jgi:hypothetical protein
LNPVPTARVIDYMGCIEQGVAHLFDWVENGVEPPESTPYRRVDEDWVVTPDGAAARSGIQPSLVASADGAKRVDVEAGAEVALAVAAQMPPRAGTIVSAVWDVDGSGAYPYAASDIDGTATELHWSITHHFDEPGTYFPVVKVRSHRSGRLDVPARSVENLARVRIVVH